jgi:1,4-alpha-glucan branching enzyme
MKFQSPRSQVTTPAGVRVQTGSIAAPASPRTLIAARATGPHPTGRVGLLRIPAPTASAVAMRYAPLADRDIFNPSGWREQPLTPSVAFAGWYELDLDTLGLPDGSYEYEFLLSAPASQQPLALADPYADRITRFAGYRGVFEIAGGARNVQPFRWDAATEAGNHLPQNNTVVIYEMPLKWMSSSSENSLVEFGTFDKVIFEHLDGLKAIGINCIELLPIEDTSQTLDWGYGTRFFFAPDFDMGTPVDTKFFIKSCHERGIRVILDVVMNFFDQACPLEVLARDWFAQGPTAGRTDWGAVLFRFNTPSYANYYAAREFLYEMAEFWITEYHIDGYRIDDFADIGNWEFVQEFRNRATVANSNLFPVKPFLVAAEDSDRNFATTSANALNGQKVVDAIWNFGYRDEIRRLATNSLWTNFGQPSRTERVRHLISKDGVWNAFGAGSFDAGYADMACSVDYATSHDVADGPRMMNVLLGSILSSLGIDGGWQTVRTAVDNPWSDAVRGAVNAALRRLFGVFAILMTSVGMPMFLAGEEFGDAHDTDYNNSEAKQQDPVQWARAQLPGHADLQTNVGKLIALRTSHAALGRNEVAFFYFHPQFDQNVAPRVFAYCRTSGQSIGSPGQVVVIANMGPDAFAAYDIPAWSWGGAALTEIGYAHQHPTYDGSRTTLTLGLDPFEVRVFTV